MLSRGMSPLSCAVVWYRTMGEALQVLQRSDLNFFELRKLLEEDDPEALEELSVPPDDGFQRIGRGGARMEPDYFYLRWRAGQPSGDPNVSGDLWAKTPAQRKEMVQGWLNSIKQSAQVDFLEAKIIYDQLNQELTTLQEASERAVLGEARVIGATTTGAAKNRALMEAAGIGAIIIEEGTLS